MPSYRHHHCQFRRITLPYKLTFVEYVVQGRAVWEKLPEVMPYNPPDTPDTADGESVGLYPPIQTPGLFCAWQPEHESREVVPLTRYGSILGRGKDSSWTIDDKRLSRKHIRFSVEDNRPFAEDLASKNGSFVNGRRIKPHERIPLYPGDVVRCGSTILVADDDVSPHLRLPEDALASAASVGMVGPFHAGLIATQVRRAAAVGQHLLLSGESGVGKELATHLLASELRQQQKISGPLVAHNCARFASEEEATSTIFGVSTGVFTGVHARAGLLEQARDGILYLDEIHALPLRAQRSLLRFVEDQLFCRIGENTPQPLRVFLILGTNIDITAAMDRNEIAFDLVSRLQSLHIPSLHERCADIPQIFVHLLEQSLNQELSSGPGSVAHPDQLEALCLLHYENTNLRELIDIANHVAARCRLENKPPIQALGEILTDRYSHHPALQRILSRASTKTTPFTSGQSHYERHKRTIIATFRECDENLAATERALKRKGLRASRRWLREYLQRWGVR